MTEETYRSAQRVAAQLEESGLTEPVKRASAERIASEKLLGTKKVSTKPNAEFDEERVPAEEVVSSSKNVTDIIRKAPARVRPQGAYDW